MWKESPTKIDIPIFKTLSPTGQTVFIGLIQTQFRNQDMLFTNSEISLSFSSLGTQFVDIFQHLTSVTVITIVHYKHPQLHLRKRQRLIATKHFSPSKKKSNPFVLIKGGEGRSPVYYIEKSLLLFHTKKYRTKDRKNLHLVQYMEFNRPLDNVDKVMNPIFLRWAIFEEVDYRRHCTDTSSVEHILDT